MEFVYIRMIPFVVFKLQYYFNRPRKIEVIEKKIYINGHFSYRIVFMVMWFTLYSFT